MPLYEFECEDCGYIFEELVTLSSKILNEYEIVAVCPKCDSAFCKKIISKTNFRLKGSGWAKDGYSKENK